MNILIFSDSFLPKISGVTISIARFARILQQKGNNIVICAPDYGKKYTYSNFDNIGKNINIIRFQGISIPSYPDIKIIPFIKGKINNIINDFKPDVIQIHSIGFLGSCGIKYGKKHNIPVIGVYHTLINEFGTYFNPFRLMKLDRIFYSRKKLSNIPKEKTQSWFNKLLFKITNFKYSQCDYITSPSHQIKKLLLQAGIKKPIAVLSNGVQLPANQASKTIANLGVPKLLHVGRTAFEKNIQVVLRSFAIILQSKPCATLTLVGDGPAKKSLIREAKILKINNSVNFLNSMPHEEITKIFSAYDLLLTASTMETQGLVILEAMANGTPCIGVDCYALPELIIHGKTGFLAKPFDYEDIARLTLRILNDEKLYQKFSAASIELAKQHDVYACADQLIALFDRIIKNSG